MSVGYVAKTLLRATFVVMVASSAGACAIIPSWLGGDSGSNDVATADDAGAVADQQAVADNSTTPDLADVPDRPTRATTPDSQRQVTASLSADRTRAKYSADALRGGTEAAAAPPPPPSAIDTSASADTSASDTSSSSHDSSDSTSSTTPAATTTADAVAPPPPTTTPGAAPVRPAPTTQVASANVPPALPAGDGRPAVPAVPAGGVPGAQAPMMTDSQLGFQPSQAPALDPSVSQFVSPSIMARYRQTSGSNVALASNAVPASSGRRSRSTAVGGPEKMSGAVVADLDALSTPAVTTATPSVYASPNGMPASAVVFFPGDTTILSASAKAQVRAAAERFRASGGTGFVRVVGHSSSRTGNMPLERHLVVIFEKSQQRANSVAQELIRDGVPADKVLVEAVGDTQPVYYESMPKGEDGNRRAEIFLQS